MENLFTTFAGCCWSNSMLMVSSFDVVNCIPSSNSTVMNKSHKFVLQSFCLVTLSRQTGLLDQSMDYKYLQLLMYIVSFSKCLASQAKLLYGKLFVHICI